MFVLLATFLFQFRFVYTTDIWVCIEAVGLCLVTDVGLLLRCPPLQSTTPWRSGSSDRLLARGSGTWSDSWRPRLRQSRFTWMLPLPRISSSVSFAGKQQNMSRLSLNTVLVNRTRARRGVHSMCLQVTQALLTIVPSRSRSPNGSDLGGQTFSTDFLRRLIVETVLGPTYLSANSCSEDAFLD